MATANEAYFDAALRHQVGIRRFTAGEVAAVQRLLEQADRDLTANLRARLRREGTFVGRRFVTKRLTRLLADIRALRQETMKSVRARTRQNLVEVAKMEGAFEQRLLQNAIPIEISFASVEIQALREIVFRRPFQGRLLNQWFRTLEQADQRGLQQAIQLGMVQGESIDQIVARVAGTRRFGFRDGVLALTRRNAEAVVRTAVNHISNASREALWTANSDIISALRWTSTLDGRTSAICRARDGKLAPVGGKPLPKGATPLVPSGARPPAHVNCRSVMVAVLDGMGIVGQRPFVVDTRTGRRRRFSSAADRRRWAAENIGSVPAATTYQEWLGRQSAGFQDGVLGPARGRLFRQGGLTLDNFVDRRGNELTLDELRATFPSAFGKAA